jgi:uncharacterized Rmd1/YagE family protein
MTGEKKIFDQIWMDRPHVSEISNIQLNQYVPTYYLNLFAHILPKGKYPEIRLLPENIMLLTPNEHYLFDVKQEEDRKKYAEMIFTKFGKVVEWEYLYAKRDALKDFYKDTFESKIVDRNLYSF